MKDKSVISVDAEEAFDTIEHSVMVKKKKSQGTKNRRSYPTFMEATQEEPPVNTALMEENRPLLWGRDPDEGSLSRHSCLT